MSTNTKSADELSYQELKDLLDKKKTAEIDKVAKELAHAKGIVAALEAQLTNLGVASAPAAKRRGRKPGFKVAKVKRTKTKGKRGAVGAAIKAYVASKGKAGVHVKDIAAHLKMKPANVTAFFYAKGNKPKYKNLGKAIWAAK